MNDHETLKLLYKQAKKACKADRSNEDLKRAKFEAKKALMSENDECSTAPDENDESPAIPASENDVVSSTENCIQVDNCCVINVSDAEGDKGGSGVDDADGFNVNSEHDSADIHQLEETYHLALAAFKSNKNDKELRRAKTAARRALDDAILLAASTTANGTTRQLTCTDCSKKFIYSMTDTAQTKQHSRKGRNDNSLPKRCHPCHSIRSNRLSINQNQRRIALDSRKRNMCYAFQKGECPHGTNCKFSHNPEHGGGGGGGKLLKTQSTDSSSK